MSRVGPLFVSCLKTRMRSKLISTFYCKPCVYEVGRNPVDLEAFYIYSYLTKPCLCWLALMTVHVRLFCVRLAFVSTHCVDDFVFSQLHVSKTSSVLAFNFSYLLWFHRYLLWLWPVLATCGPRQLQPQRRIEMPACLRHVLRQAVPRVCSGPRGYRSRQVRTRYWFWF